MQQPETEFVRITWILLKEIREIISNKLIFGGFYPFGTTVRLNPNEVKQMLAHKLVRFYYIQPTPKDPNIVTIKKSYKLCMS